MNSHFKVLSLSLVTFLGIGWAATALHAQGSRTMPEDEVKGRAEIRRLATSSSAEDRLSAVQQLACMYMDYALLWQLMNDADKGVRLTAIGAMTSPSCTSIADQPLTAELAQKMAAMLEKEVTPERIAAAFAPGPVKNDETGLITAAAEMLDHLYLYAPLQQSPAQHAAWQRRVPRQIFLAAASAGKGPFSQQLYACMMSMLRLLREPALLSETLPLLMQRLDSPDAPPHALLETLRVLWSYHDLLSHDRPLHLLLLMQTAPRLDSLRTRILAPMKDGQDKEQATLLLGYYQEAIETARKKLPTPSQPPQTAPTPAQTPATPATAEAAERLITPPVLPPLSPQEQQQRRTQLQRLTASSAAQDRISAADDMVAEGIHPDLYQKLLHDPDPTVSEAAMDALLDACQETPCLIPLDEARKIAVLLEPEVAEECIATLYEGKGAQQKHRIHMACHAALALSQLYRQRALLPGPSSYGHWQERVLRSLVIRIAGDYRNPAGENDEPVLRIFLAITDPATLQQTVDLLDTYPNLDDIPAARQLFYLTELWVHPLLGEGRPMNPVLLQQLAPVWQPVRDHILRNVGAKDHPDQEAAALLARIDAAVARVVQQLSPAVK